MTVFVACRYLAANERWVHELVIPLLSSRKPPGLAVSRQSGTPNDENLKQGGPFPPAATTDAPVNGDRFRVP